MATPTDRAIGPARVALAVALLVCGVTVWAQPTQSQYPYPVERIAEVFAARGIPVTGFADAGLAVFDDVVVKEMRLFDIPAAALSITREGRTVLSRGYGYSDGALSVPASPNTLMRWASVDKVVALTCVDYLIKQGTVLPSGAPLTRSTRLLDLLRQYGLKPPRGMEFAEGAEAITIGLLCEHKSGVSSRYAEDVDASLRPPGAAAGLDIASLLLSRPLDYPPGTQTAYSNNGFGLLRICLALLTGDFVSFLRQKIFLSEEVAESHLRPRDRDQREVFYWSSAMGPSPLPEDKGKLIPVPDGGGRLAERGGFGWFAASAPAMASYLCAFYIASGDPYWVVDAATGQRRLSHDNGYNEFVGSDTGTSAFIIQNRWYKYNLAFVCNRRGERAVEEHPSLAESLHEALRKTLE